MLACCQLQSKSRFSRLTADFAVGKDVGDEASGDGKEGRASETSEEPEYQVDSDIVGYNVVRMAATMGS